MVTQILIGLGIGIFIGFILKEIAKKDKDFDKILTFICGLPGLIIGILIFLSIIFVIFWAQIKLFLFLS